MEWLAENWLWVIFGIMFVAMHMFGHGGGGCGLGGKDSADKPGNNADGSAKPAGVRFVCRMITEAEINRIVIV